MNNIEILISVGTIITMIGTFISFLVRLNSVKKDLENNLKHCEETQNELKRRIERQECKMQDTEIAMAEIKTKLSNIEMMLVDIKKTLSNQ